MDVAANGNTSFILSKESEIREKIKTFAEEKTGKKIRTPYYLSYLEYDKEKNMPYYELIEKEDDKEDTFSYYDSIGKDIYKLYVQPNYYYSDEHSKKLDNYNINTLIENVERNNPEITNIQILSTQSLPFGKTSENDTYNDYNHSSEGKRYVLANVTKNGITTKTKIVFESSRIGKYHNIIEINENDFKTRRLSEETKNKINEILEQYNNNIYYNQYVYSLASDDLQTEQDSFNHYISLNAYNKDSNKTELFKHIVLKPNFSENNDENLAKLVEIGNINEKDSSDTYNVATFDVNQNFDGYATRTDRIPYYEIDSRYHINLKENINDIIDEYAKEYIANKLGERIFVVSENSTQAVHYDKELKKVLQRI